MVKMTDIKLELMTDIDMFQYVPTGGFKWLTEKQINKIMNKTMFPDNKKGYIFEVGLEYPEELHELHNDYPLAAEKMKVAKDMLSPYCKTIQEKFGVIIWQVAKLTPTLTKKRIMYCTTEICNLSITRSETEKSP